MRSRFIKILLLYIALNVYIGWHGAIVLDVIGLGSYTAIYVIAFAIVSLSYLIGRSRALPRPAGRWLKRIGSYYFAIFEFAVVLLPLADIAGVVMKWSGIGADMYVPLLSWIAAGIVAVLLIVGSYNAWSPVVRTYEVEIDKQAGELKQLIIAVASDIHLGDVVGNRHLRRLIKGVNELQPDLILLPGDVIDDSIEPFVRERMADELKRLKSRYGTYAVLGNHEYYGGALEEFVKRMGDVGIPVLRDETVLIAGAVIVAGRKDRTAESMDPAGRRSAQDLLADLDRTLPVILLDHQPYHLELAEAAGADILLSGHTHRGQLAPNHWITRRLFELDWGYKRKGRMHAIVSSGFGTWGPPIRLASRSEIVQIRVRFTSASGK